MGQWYYGENGVQHGPVDDAELDQLLAAGRIQPTTLVWREGMNEWQPVAQVRSQGAPIIATPAGYPGSGIAPPTSGLAIASLVCGILGLTTCLLVPGIPAVICGHMALSQIDKSPAPVAGRGMALAGLITGYVAVVPMIAGLLFFVVMFFTALFSSP